MRLVLWPSNLMGGMLSREGGLGGAERGEAGEGRFGGFGGGLNAANLRGIAGRVTDADALLEGKVNEQLRDWDLW